LKIKTQLKRREEKRREEKRREENFHELVFGCKYVTKVIYLY
jgi:hypothetical protein